MDVWFRTGFEDLATRCVRKTYRVDLVAVGQPVLLWISGQDRDHPAGIYAQGHTTGAVDTGPANGSADAGALTMFVSLEALRTPVLRRDLLLHPVLSRIEVVRMPAGSNPSFLSKTELAELRQAWPAVTVG